jgi:hypothetical protein
VHIRFRFAAKDGLGNVSYFPANDAYDLTDKVNCASVTPSPTPTPTNTPTTFHSQTGPHNTTISNSSFCSQTYTVKVSDPDGIAEVKLLYNVDGITPTYSLSVPAGDYYLMSHLSGQTYEVTAVIDSSVGSKDVVRYRYAVEDNLGNIQESPNFYYYTDTVDCGKTIYTNPVYPTGTISVCSQVYSVDVADANGISNVEVHYTISDGVNTPVSDLFTLPKTAGDSYSGTYNTTMTISIAATFNLPATVNFDFKAKDTRGTWTLLFSGSYTDNIPCP